MTGPPPEGDPLCPRCGAPHGPNQEYCLECGLRLTGTGGVIGRLSKAWRDRFGWYPGDWVWRVLLGFLIAVAGATAAIVLSDAGAQNEPIVATQGGSPHAPTTAPGTATVVLPTVPSGTPTGAPSTPTEPPPPTTTAPRPGALVSWPAGRSGFTVVLQSVPAGAGRALAVSRARDASRAGLPQVGVLDSSRYASLHPGYYVVFTGVFAGEAEAASALQQARAICNCLAYQRQIVP